jgi:hypothetical protein
MAKPPAVWREAQCNDPLRETIYPLAPDVAKRLFLDRFEELRNQ